MFGTLCVPGRVRRHLCTPTSLFVFVVRLVTFLCTRTVTRLWLVRPFTRFRCMSVSLYTNRCTASDYFPGLRFRRPSACVYQLIFPRCANVNSTPVPLFVFVIRLVACLCLCAQTVTRLLSVFQIFRFRRSSACMFHFRVVLRMTTASSTHGHTSAACLYTRTVTRFLAIEARYQLSSSVSLMSCYMASHGRTHICVL